MSETTTIIKGTFAGSKKSRWIFPEFGYCVAVFEGLSFSDVDKKWCIYSSDDANLIGMWVVKNKRFLLPFNGGWERRDVGIKFPRLEDAVRYAYLQWEGCGRDPWRKF